MTRTSLTAALVLLLARVAGAQPAPAGQTQPAPAPAPTPEPEPAQPPADTTPPVDPTPEPSPLVEEPKPDDKPTVTAKYDGGLKFSTDDKAYEMKLSFRNQVRFQSDRSFEDGAEFANAIYIARSRFQAEGHLFGKDNRFKMELGLGDTGSFSFLKDMFVEKRLPDSPIYFRMGQWKRPFNRAEIVSDFASTFNERSIQNELAGGGRSLGVALHNDYEKSPEGLEWVFGMFNTFNGGSDRPTIPVACVTDPIDGDVTCVNGRPTTIPLDWGPTLNARVGYNSPKMKGYSESDLEGGPLRYAVGAAYKVDLANFAEAGEDSWADNMSHGLEVDALIKAMGYSAHAGVVMMKLKSANTQFGLFVQPGMMLVPKKMEVAARFALTTLTQAGAMGSVDRNQIEARAAFNYYWHGHTWKVASDIGFLKLTGDMPSEDKGDLQIRVMMQLQI
ncbi:MAG TPA: hypothetical protein VIV11_01085 [Kofleriaceae bacterium]